MKKWQWPDGYGRGEAFIWLLCAVKEETEGVSEDGREGGVDLD